MTVNGEQKNAKGLVLTPCVAWGSWQGGCLYRWAQEGVEFQTVFGISAGALNGAAWLQGDTEVLARSWNNLSNKSLLVPSLRFSPLSLFSFEGLRKIMSWVDEERARKNGRCVLHVATLCREDALPWIATFDPRGRWDEPLMEHLLASCAIPGLFPPVSVRSNGVARTLVDGGIAGKKRISFECVSRAEEVFILDATRPDDPVSGSLNPLAWINNKGKRRGREQLRSGIDSLKAASPPPRIYHFYPSRVLDFCMLSCDTDECRKAFQLGMKDADDFMANRQRHRI